MLDIRGEPAGQHVHALYSDDERGKRNQHDRYRDQRPFHRAASSRLL
jgi:hypothetical protein